MRVMFVASNALGKTTLRLEQEITRLQLMALENIGSAVEFSFFPALRFEEFQQRVWQTKPDILHICAHGEKEYLEMSNGLETEVQVTREVLQGLLSGVDKLKLIYLNVCNSFSLAETLVNAGVTEMAIGTTQAITNLAAREGAVIFYQNLLKGRSVQSAYQAGKAMVSGLDQSVQTELFCAETILAHHEQLHTPLRILARFNNEETPIDKNGVAGVELGVVGCPATTNQVIFFTDDESFIIDEDELESSLAEVIRTAAVAGEVWLDETYWSITGNFRIFACVSTIDGKIYSLTSDLCMALSDCIEIERLERTRAPETVIAAIEKLRIHDGAKVAHRRRQSIRRTGTKTKSAKKSRS